MDFKQLEKLCNSVSGVVEASGILGGRMGGKVVLSAYWLSQRHPISTLQKDVD